MSIGCLRYNSNINLPESRIIVKLAEAQACTTNIDEGASPEGLVVEQFQEFLPFDAPTSLGCEHSVCGRKESEVYEWRVRFCNSEGPFPGPPIDVADLVPKPP